MTRKNIQGKTVVGGSLSRRAFLTASAALAVGVASLPFLSGCGDGDSVSKTVWGGFSTRLDGDSLRFEGGRAAYNAGGKVARTGIDVSEHQGIIDWSTVAADGIDFAFIRLGTRGNTEGNLFLDNYVSYNIENARDAGLDVHAYFFSQAISASEASEEADFAIRTAIDNDLEGCYLAYDLERISGRTYGMPTDTMAEAADAFCTYVKNHGYKPMLYGNRVDLTFFGQEACESWPIWLAQYAESNPESPCDFALWQYANDGSVAGIQTDVDLNLWV